MLLIAGCELLVPDSLPQFTCTPGTDSCPAGMVCDPGSHQCVSVGDGAPLDAPSDQPIGSDVNDTGPTDVVVDNPTSCRHDGCPCGGASECDSHICGDQLTLTTPLWTQLGSHGVCVDTCCTSSDCPTGYVCFATGAGGNYCVDPTLLSRSPPGSGAGGTSCSSDSSCRSGLCAGTVCQDTCCSTTASGQCGAGYECRVQPFPGRASFDINVADSCMTTSGAGTGGNGASCFGGNNDCKSDLCCGGGVCSANTCVDTCRNSADCGSNHYCDYVVAGSNNVVPICQNGSGTYALGQACTSSTQCSTAICDPYSSKCTDVCYTTADCKAQSTWSCRPELVAVSGGGSFSVLLCGP